MPDRIGSYGQYRSFAGIEDFAIRRRLKPAQALLQRLSQQDPRKTITVLELGCGFWGRNLQELRRANPPVEFTGVDLVVTKDTTDVLLIEGDLTQWVPQRSYDVVFSLAVIEHLVDPVGHLKLMSNCLKPGGRAGLTTPTPPSHSILAGLGRLGIFDREEIGDHKIYLTETGLRASAKQAGLEVEEYRQFSLGLNQWMGLRRN